MKVKELKSMIELLEKYHPEKLDDWCAAEHDMFYLCDEPDGMSKEFLDEMDKLGFYISEDSIAKFT